MPGPDHSKAWSAVTGAGVGFGIGFVVVWQGCGTGNWIPLALFGGALFSIPGAIIGALFG